MSQPAKISLACSTLLALVAIIWNTEVAAQVATESHPHAPAVTVDPATVKSNPKLKRTPEETVIYVGDLHCGHCAKKIASKLYTVKGVMKVRTDLKADVAIVTPQSKKQLDPMALWTAANNSGFPAMRLEGPTGTYVLDAKTKAAKLVSKPAAVVPKS